MLTILSKRQLNAKIVIGMEQTQSFLTRLLQDLLAFHSCDPSMSEHDHGQSNLYS